MTKKKEWMQPLLDLRNELDVENDLDRRDFRRRQGQIQLYERNVDGLDAKEIVNIPGPYTKQWREEWLRRVLQAQIEARQNAPTEMQNIELIAIEELSEIRRIWLEEFHEFDDVLPSIYKDVTGQDFADPRPNAGNTQLGLDEWSILEEICDDPMHFELMARLLSTERRFQTMSRRVGIIDALEKHFETSSRPKKEAIDNAHLNWNIKKAAKAGDVEAVKQLTDGTASTQETKPAASWADLKFKGRE